MNRSPQTWFCMTALWLQRVLFLSQYSGAASAQVLESSFLGGNIGAQVVTRDPQGNLVLIGTADRAKFLCVDGTFTCPDPPAPERGLDVFVAKLSPDGAGLVYWTYLGGSKNEFFSGRFALGADGSLFVAGDTASDDFPVTPDALASTLDGDSDNFVVKLDPAGDVVFSTYFVVDGSSIFALALNPSGELFVTGISPWVATIAPTSFVLDPQHRDSFVLKMDQRGQVLFASLGYFGTSTWSKSSARDRRKSRPGATAVPRSAFTAASSATKITPSTRAKTPPGKANSSE